MDHILKGQVTTLKVKMRELTERLIRLEERVLQLERDTTPHKLAGYD